MNLMRKVPLITNNAYHVFNRGVNKYDIFFSDSDYEHFLAAAKHYLTKNSKFSYEKYPSESNEPGSLQGSLKLEIAPRIEILAYCLMPNHFHFLVKQLTDKGIASYMQRFINSYVHHVNIKYKRVGPLFQGPFKGVRIESDDHLLHLSRYIHLNPLVSNLTADLKDYKWSSYSSYFKGGEDGFVKPNQVLKSFRSIKDYEKFVSDQEGYARSLEQMKHLKDF